MSKAEKIETDATKSTERPSPELDEAIQHRVAQPTKRLPPQTVTGELTRVMRDQSLASIADGQDGAPQMVTNLDLGTDLGKKLMIRSTGIADFDVAKLKGHVIPVTYYMAERARIRDKDSGELRDVPRITLFTADGLFIAFSSWAVARFMDKVLLAYGQGPWLPEPLSLSVQLAQDRNGNLTYDCAIV